MQLLHFGHVDKQTFNPLSFKTGLLYVRVHLRMVFGRMDFALVPLFSLLPLLLPLSPVLPSHALSLLIILILH